MTSVRFSRLVQAALIYAILLITAFAVLVPIFWIVMSSLNPGKTLLSTTFFPDRLSLEHYEYLFTKTDFPRWFRNTLKVATGNMLLSTFLVITSAYAFSRFRFPGRRSGLLAMLILQMFPGFMGMVAIYVLLLHVGLLDTLWGLILVYAGGAVPYGTWLAKGYLDGIPRSIEEAAFLDGASHTQVFFHVTLPLTFPILTFVALTNFIGPWMDFILARIVLRSTANKTLALGLFEMVTGRGNTEFTTFAAGAVIIALPITLLSFFLQRFLIEGLTAGANKT
ncbi:sugar ABC transporter permease [Brockia lithotrophica]|uniref:Carbohydrate ABC transporter membrane protein 2 (CUT1 family) n=1 Tax=Brockia lithotrophica TaxID=933949 RepID=A0A660KTQ1_9BACL|nr:sugar ABC transporter permease [Brockia lithotrophica]RKQ84130.1 carbohydrate ABC transporter membrane protein 2 (CUT1 family) [Brockia lithotrophica]